MDLPILPTSQDHRLTASLDRAIPAGGLLRLRASGTHSLRAIDAVDIVVAGTSCEQVQRFDPAAMREDFGWFILHLPVVTVTAPRRLSPGDTVELDLTIRSFAPAKAPGGPVQKSAPYAGLGWTYTLVTAEDLDAGPDAWEPVATRHVFDLVAGACARYEANLRPGDVLAIQSFDAALNPVCPAGGTATVDGSEYPLDTTRPVTLIPCRHDRAEVTVAGRPIVCSARPVGLEEAPVFFGEFHWHTDFSGDGQRDMAEALGSARDELCLDFAGPSDHLGYEGIVFHDRTIDDQQAICDRFNEPGRFAIVPTYERSEREGHVNIVADSWDTLRTVAHNTDQSAYPAHRFPLDIITGACPAGKAIMIPHHPNMDSHAREGVVYPEDGRPFWCRMDWGPTPELKATRLVEIHQSRGSCESESPDPAWHGDVGGYGSSAQTALARGYRLGFVAGTDNHCGWPTRKPEGWCGLTAVLADDLSTQAVFAALHARRCYATTGVRIVADYRFNDHPMGSELCLEPGAGRRFTIMVRGTAPLAAVQIVSCGAVLADLPVDTASPDFDGSWTDERPGRPLRDCYYYVRIRQSDGHCAWLSPVWVDLPSG